jgi:N-acetylmuramoyl-L-alanine amidase
MLLPKIPKIEKKKERDIPVLQVNKDYSSPNFSMRSAVIDSIIIHHTGGKAMGCVNWLCNEESGVSAHYVITKYHGMIYQLVEDNSKAWHAGRSAFDADKDGTISPLEKNWNNRSVGIELEAVEPYDYSEMQLHSLDKLVYELIYKHHISTDLILGHKEISPGRKIDPANFDMFVFRQKMKDMMAA